MEYTGVIAESQESLLMVDLWVPVAIGIVGGLFDQRNCTLPTLYRHATVAMLTGGAAGAAMLVFKNSTVMLWLCIGVFGLASGPTVGYSYELNNRVCVSSETGMSIVTLGLSFGSTAIPYATSLVLDNTDSAEMFIVIIVSSMLVPYLLMSHARRLAESRKHRRKEGVVDQEGVLPSSSAPITEITEETRLLRNRDHT